jgi:hypothetical protein
MGPQGLGAATPVYVYNQDFDGAGYNPGTEYVVGALFPSYFGLGLNGTYFVSAPESLQISTTGGVGAQSGVFSKSGQITYINGDDFYVDTYIDYDQFTSAPIEIQFIEAGVVRSDLGLNPSTGHFYAYNSGSQIVFSSFSAGFFSHVNLTWHAKTGLSDYTINGTLCGQNLACTQTTPSSAPSTCVGIVFPGSSDANDVVLVDNLTVYHY